MKRDAHKLYLKRFGAKVRSTRKAIDMTQEKLADVTGFHRTYVSQIERGLANPTLVNLFELAEGLNTKVPLLIGSVFEEAVDEASDNEVGCDAE